MNVNGRVGPAAAPPSWARVRRTKVGALAVTRGRPRRPPPCLPLCAQLTFLEGAPADPLGGRPGTGTAAALQRADPRLAVQGPGCLRCK